MKRRSVLATAGIALAMHVSGCIGDTTPDDDDSTTDDDDDQQPPGGDDDDGTNNGRSDTDWYEWHHPVHGRIDLVSQGRVYGHEHFADDDGDGGIYALDATTGDHHWTYGNTGGFTGYSPVAVGDDGVYVGFGDDALGSEAGYLIALDGNGEKRWKRNTGSIYRPPKLTEDLVVAAGDDDAVYAVDRASGDQEWVTDDLAAESFAGPTVIAADDRVYVDIGHLVVLDPTDGERQWQYGDTDDAVDTILVEDDTVFVNGDDWIAAVDSGDERWREALNHRELVGVANELVIIATGDRLLALDPDDGSEEWRSPEIDPVDAETPLVVASTDDTVYVVGAALHAVNTTDGTRRWEQELAGEHQGGFGRQIDPVDDGVIVQTTETRIDRFSSTGESTWWLSVDQDITDQYVNGDVYISTESGLYRVNQSAVESSELSDS